MQVVRGIPSDTTAPSTKYAQGHPEVFNFNIDINLKPVLTEHTYEWTFSLNAQDMHKMMYSHNHFYDTSPNYTNEDPIKTLICSKANNDGILTFDELKNKLRESTYSYFSKYTITDEITHQTTNKIEIDIYLGECTIYEYSQEQDIAIKTGPTYLKLVFSDKCDNSHLNGTLKVNGKPAGFYLISCFVYVYKHAPNKEYEIYYKGATTSTKN